jgi:hypothetical protein
MCSTPCRRCGAPASAAAESPRWWVQHWLQVFVLDDRGQCRPARRGQVRGGHRQHRLADELDEVDGQQRIAGQQRADVLERRQVLVGDHQAHPGYRVAWGGVDAEDARVGAIGQARVHVQLVGKLQAIVDVHRLAADVLVGAVVLDAAADAAGQALGEQFGHLGLGLLRGVLRHSRSPGFRCAAFALR